MLSRQEPRKHLGQSSHPGFWSPRLSRVSRDLPVRSEGAPWSLTARFHCTCICFTHRSSAQVQVCLHHCSGSRLSVKFVKDFGIGKNIIVSSQWWCLQRTLLGLSDSVEVGTFLPFFFFLYHFVTLERQKLTYGGHANDFCS